MNSFFNAINQIDMPVRVLVLASILVILIAIKHIHIMQLNSYNFDQQIIWYKKNLNSFISFMVLALIVFLNLLIQKNTSVNFYKSISTLISLIIILIILLVILIENLPRKQKKKLVYTNRIKRLLAICLIIFLIVFIFSFIANTNENIRVASLLLVVAFSPLFIFFAFCISLPIENGIRKKFMNEAKAIIDANADLFVIGITGSFGKTSVKYYLSTILKSKYSVCMTPESFNTAMGATLTIKNDLRNIDDIFICEMGARRVGDIKEICDIVSPNGAIITDVGNMHLDTFKTIENVLNTKFELVESAVHSRKTCKFGENPILVNGDNELIRKKVIDSFGITERRYIKYYGFNKENTFYADSIVSSDKGTKFRFNSESNVCEEFETRLLGKYNIMNLVAAISYSLLIGVDMPTIKNAIKSIEPVPHRLQILPYGSNDLIIDDAYNSNPLGARNAVDVLSSFDGYTKVLITPGMVELSDKQDTENEKFAEYAGSKVDYAIVVGHTNKIALDKGFGKSLPKDKLLNIERIEDAINYVRLNISGKKVILLENDLSDNY